MKLTKMDAEVLTINDIQGLAPITITMINYQGRAGKLVVECAGSAWAAHWGPMGDTIRVFIARADNQYLISCLAPRLSKTVVDFPKVSEKIGVSVSSDVELAMACDEVIEVYGHEFWVDLPREDNPEYNYLNRIVTAIKDAMGEG